MPLDGERCSAEHRLPPNRYWRLHAIVDCASHWRERLAERIDWIGIGTWQLAY
jgi:hypothetical protein